MNLTSHFVENVKGVLNNVAWNFAGKFVIDKEGNPMPVKNEKNLEADIARLAAA